METINMKIEANKNLIRLWIEEGWNNNRNSELAESVFSKDWTTATPFPNQPLGPAGALFFVEEYRKSFSDYHITITHIVADTEFVSYRFEVVAAHTGIFLGIKPTHRKVKYSGMAILKIENQRIAKTWTEFDMAGLKSQLTQ
jgi:predicted ester cyclase